MRKSLKQPRGKIVVALALALPVILGMAAFAINLAFLQRTHSQLSSIVESSANAAIDTYNLTRNTDVARKSAKQVASHNEVQGTPLHLADEDIEFGRYERFEDKWVFSADHEQLPNAVRVTGRIVDDGSYGPARFLRFLNASEKVEVTRKTIALQLDRDIALVVDRSYAGAFAEDELIPTSPVGPLGLPLPKLAPPTWNWCLTLPLQSRFRNVALAVDGFLVELSLTAPDEQVTLVSFADEANIESPLSLDYSLVISALQRLIKSYCGGLSDKEEGLEHAVEALNDPDARANAAKMIVLISDSPLDEGNAVTAAANARTNGITVHTVSYGQDVDQSLMSQIATQGGGNHWHVDNVLQLTNTLKRIAATPPTAIQPNP